MTTYAQYLELGVFTSTAQMRCDMYSHRGLDGNLSTVRHRKMLHDTKGPKTRTVLRVFGPLYPARKIK